jgi:ABC-type polysaccharide/polyol phosphate export permease
MNYFNLLKEMASAQFKNRDQSTLFGYLWSFLNPLLMLSVLYLIFHSRTGEGIDHYEIFLLVGIVILTNYSKTTSSLMKVLVSQKGLTAYAIFPKEVMVISGVFAHIIELVISIIISILFAILLGIPPRASLLFLPVLIFMQILLVLWISLILSNLYVFVRDIDHIYQVFLRILFFITPIFYSMDYVDGISRIVVQLNPLTYLVEVGRNIIIDGVFPNPVTSVAFISVNLLLLAISLLIFRRQETAFGEFL